MVGFSALKIFLLETIYVVADILIDCPDAFQNDVT